MQMIPRRLSHCKLGKEAFLPGSEYLSILDSDGNRKDFCPQCWAKIERPKEGYFWKGQIPKKKEKVLLPDQKALELFKNVEDPKLRFLLALYLQRKSQLARRTETIYEIPDTGEVFNIEKVVLSADEGAALAQQIDRMIYETTTT